MWAFVSLAILAMILPQANVANKTIYKLLDLFVKVDLLKKMRNVENIFCLVSRKRKLHHNILPTEEDILRYY